MIYITAIRMSGGEKHEHIQKLQWLNPVSRETGEATRSEMIDWIDKGGDARVHGPHGDVKVVVVRANPPYLRTIANGSYTDNLLALPRF